MSVYIYIYRRGASLRAPRPPWRVPSRAPRPASPADKPWDVVSVTRRSSGVAPRACVRAYARVLVPPNLYIHTYIHTYVTLATAGTADAAPATAATAACTRCGARSRRPLAKSTA